MAEAARRPIEVEPELFAIVDALARDAVAKHRRMQRDSRTGAKPK